MSGDVGAEIAAVLAEWWHRELGLQCVHDDKFVPSCEKWATQFLRTGIAALAPLIAESAAAAKAEALRGAADEAEALRTFAHGKNPTSQAHAIGYGTARRLIVRLLRDRAAALDPEATP